MITHITHKKMTLNDTIEDEIDILQHVDGGKVPLLRFFAHSENIYIAFLAAGTDIYLGLR